MVQQLLYLGILFLKEAAAYDAMAKEASLSRMYGGIHYRSDCEGGLVCGKKCWQLCRSKEQEQMEQNKFFIV